MFCKKVWIFFVFLVYRLPAIEDVNQEKNCRANCACSFHVGFCAEIPHVPKKIKTSKKVKKATETPSVTPSVKMIQELPQENLVLSAKNQQNQNSSALTLLDALPRSAAPAQEQKEKLPSNAELANTLVAHPNHGHHVEEKQLFPFGVEKQKNEAVQVEIPSQKSVISSPYFGVSDFGEQTTEVTTNTLNNVDAEFVEQETFFSDQVSVPTRDPMQEPESKNFLLKSLKKLKCSLDSEIQYENEEAQFDEEDNEDNEEEAVEEIKKDKKKPKRKSLKTV